MRGECHTFAIFKDEKYIFPLLILINYVMDIFQTRPYLSLDQDRSMPIRSSLPHGRVRSFTGERFFLLRALLLYSIFFLLFLKLCIFFNLDFFELILIAHIFIKFKSE
jgi:hypothetical protein